MVIPFQFEGVMVPIFENGKAEVQKDGRTFFVDKTGKEVK